MKKKIVSLCLVFALAVSTLAACGNKQNEKESSQQQETQQTTPVESSQPTEVVEEISYPEQISVWVRLATSAKGVGFMDYNEAYWAQWLEETTDTHVKWTHPDSSAVAEKFNLLIASGNYTDVIVHSWASVQGGAESFVTDEVILDLTDMIPENMPNLWAFLQANPDILNAITNDKGRILYIPFIREDEANCIFTGPTMREDWLTKLGLKAPANTDELYTVLKAFKEKDPNGNGQADEIPMTGMLFQQKPYGIGYLTGAWGVNFGLYIKDGKIVWGPAEDVYAEALAYITKLFKEGLIDVDYLLNTKSTMNAKISGDRAGFAYNYQPSTFYKNAEFNDGTKKMAGIPMLSNDGSGKGVVFNNDYVSKVVNNPSLAITTTCEDPEGVLRWLDVIYSEEGLRVMNYGQENVHYTMVDGKPYVDYYSMSTEDQQVVKANNMVIDTAFPTIQQWGAVSSTYSPWGAEAIDIWAKSLDASAILPKEVKLNEEEKEAVTEIWTQITTYADSVMNKIVIGEESMDKWPEFVAEFKKMGLDKVLEAYNAAYQRYLNKK